MVIREFHHRALLGRQAGHSMGHQVVALTQPEALFGIVLVAADFRHGVLFRGGLVGSCPSLIDLIPGNTKQPGGDVGWRSERRRAPPDHEHDLIQHLLNHLRLSKAAPEKSAQAWGVVVIELLERGGVTCGHVAQEGVFVLFVPGCPTRRCRRHPGRLWATRLRGACVQRSTCCCSSYSVAPFLLQLLARVASRGQWGGDWPAAPHALWWSAEVCFQGA